MPPKDRGRSKLPIPLPRDMILKDIEKGRDWRLGSQIAQGGFGLIYLASPNTNVPVEDDAVHVVKVEYLENGPLFSELKFYQRAAKEEHIRKWMNLKKLRCLGVPVFWGSGLAEYKGKSYRFMIMERLGQDLQRIFEDCGSRFKKETVLQLGARILDTLEFIHENEYVHADIKAANLLLGYTNPHEVYLADYGLSYRYCPNGNHKQYQENPRNGHNGTIEFTSLDAHKGVAPSRRGDLEILGYCMLQWLCGKLPWEQNLKDPVAVQAAKTRLMDELPDSVMEWDSSGSRCSEIAKFLARVYDLAYDEKPEYQVLKKILLDGLESSGTCYDGPLEFSAASGTRNHRAAKASERQPKNSGSHYKQSTVSSLLAYEQNLTPDDLSDSTSTSLVYGKEVILGQFPSEDQQTPVRLPKPLPKAGQRKQEKMGGEEYVCQNKACTGTTGKQLQGEGKLRQLNRPLHQTEPQQVPLPKPSLKPPLQKQNKSKEEESNCPSRPCTQVTRRQFQTGEKPIQYNITVQEPEHPPESADHCLETPVQARRAKQKKPSCT